MPIIGYFGGMYLESYITAYDHWIAFGLLLFIGLKMIREALSGKRGKESCYKDPSHGWSLLILAVATSIDTLAVGLSLGVLNKPVLFPSIVIGVVCSVFSILGVAIGNRVGAFSSKYAEVAGGIMLIAIGVKIVVEHFLA